MSKVNDSSSGSSPPADCTQEEIDNAVDTLSKASLILKGCLETIQSERLSPARIPGMLLSCQSLVELCEQISTFGKMHLKSSEVIPQIRSIILTIEEMDRLVISYSSFPKRGLIKGTTKFPFLKFNFSSSGSTDRVVSTESSVDNINFSEVTLFARLIESEFLARLLIVEVQIDVIHKDTITHDEQINRMEILNHTVSRLNPKEESSHNEILVCLSLLDGFCNDYFQVYGGLEGANELTRISRTIWDLEKSLSYNRANNTWGRENCVREMLEIMDRVQFVSKSQFGVSEAKIQGKVALVQSARYDELACIKDLQTRYPSPKFGKFLRELKFDTFNAEHRLLKKLSNPGNASSPKSSSIVLDIGFDSSPKDERFESEINKDASNLLEHSSEDQKTEQMDSGGKTSLSLFSKVVNSIF